MTQTRLETITLLLCIQFRYFEKQVRLDAPYRADFGRQGILNYLPRQSGRLEQVRSFSAPTGIAIQGKGARGQPFITYSQPYMTLETEYNDTTTEIDSSIGAKPRIPSSKCCVHGDKRPEWAVEILPQKPREKEE